MRSIAVLALGVVLFSCVGGLVGVPTRRRLLRIRARGYYEHGSGVYKQTVPGHSRIYCIVYIVYPQTRVESSQSAVLSFLSFHAEDVPERTHNSGNPIRLLPFRVVSSTMPSHHYFSTRLLSLVSALRYIRSEHCCVYE